LLEAIRKESLSDSIARAIKEMIDRKGFLPGDKLPSISEMATQFEVGSPTVREALRQLQAVAVIEMRHGSGVYVAEHHDALFVANPIRPSKPTRSTMLDLIETRLMIETYTTGLAAKLVTDEQLARMNELLDEAESALKSNDLESLRAANMDFHNSIAEASQNGVAYHLLRLLAGLFRSEQVAILKIFGSPWKDLDEHRHILEALRVRDPELAAERMRAHLDGVKQVLANYQGDIPNTPPLDA
jgi:GntR family transcriptional repressor for pyruvate dehydrogenase complex